MRHVMMLLSLIAALSATPLRLSEAAHDLGRSLAELGEDSGIEIPDGGIGDDSDATIRTATCEVPASFGWLAEILPDLPGPIIPPGWHLFRRPEDPPRARATLPRRLALLQSFLC